MRGFFLWAWRVSLAVLMFVAGVGPEDAQSNISGWLELAGLDRAATITADWSVSPNLIWACALLIAISFIPNALKALPEGAVVIPDMNIKPKAKGEKQIFRDLNTRSVAIMSRIRRLRAVSYYWRDQNTFEEIVDTANDGLSLLLSFAEQGLDVPQMDGTDAMKTCIGLHTYFSALSSYMRDGHVDLVKARATVAAERARSEAASFDTYNWWTE